MLAQSGSIGRTGVPGGASSDAAYQLPLGSTACRNQGPEYLPNGQLGTVYGIERLRWGPNAVYFHGGETSRL